MEISVFLHLDDEASETFQTLIDAFADTYSGLSFPPHVTLLFADSPLEETKQRIELVARSHEPIDLSLGDAVFSDSFWRAAYIPVENSDKLERLQREVTGSERKSGYSFAPHVSVLYGKSAGIENYIRAASATLPPIATAVAISVLTLEDEKLGWEIPKNWKEVLRVNLADRAST